MKNLFNFYLDDDLKKTVQEKLVRLSGETPKGQVASLIRVLLRNFANTPDEKVPPELINAVVAEYEYTTKLNKRSRM